jgi:hypothetical protein
MCRTIRSIRRDFPNARPVPHCSVPIIGLTSLSERTHIVASPQKLPNIDWSAFAHETQFVSQAAFIWLSPAHKMRRKASRHLYGLVDLIETRFRHQIVQWPSGDCRAAGSQDGSDARACICMLIHSNIMHTVGFKRSHR